jgi:hypothetical protein
MLRHILEKLLGFFVLPGIEMSPQHDIEANNIGLLSILHLSKQVGGTCASFLSTVDQGIEESILHLCRVLQASSDCFLYTL